MRINKVQLGVLAVVCMYNFTPSFPLRSGVPSGIRYPIERRLAAVAVRCGGGGSGAAQTTGRVAVGTGARPVCSV